MVEYAKHLQRTSVSSLTQTASENVDSKKVGRKYAVKSRKQNISISPKKSYGAAQDCQFYHRVIRYQVQAPYDRPQDYQIYQQATSSQTQLNSQLKPSPGSFYIAEYTYFSSFV